MLKISRSIRRTKTQWGLDGEPIEFEWNFFTGFSSLSLLREMQNDLETKNIKPEDFKDKIIFMSMLNDIVWNKNDEKCFSNAEEVRNYAMMFLQGHWTFLGPGSEKSWYGDSHDQKRQRNCTANKMVQRFKETGRTFFQSTSDLSRGILKQRKGKCTIHFSGDSTNRALLFLTVHSVNQLSVHGAVANWCHQFALTEEERRVATLVETKKLPMVEPEEVELLVFRPTQAPGNLMQ